MSHDEPNFEIIKPYDQIFQSIEDWSAARAIGIVTVAESEGVEVSIDGYESAAKQPTIPFERLKRELGSDHIAGQEVLDMTPDLQQKISNWVGKVTKPFDLIQRAEGNETPSGVFYASKIRASKNKVDNLERAKTRSTSGRAAVRRQYRTTQFHHDIAQDRATKLALSLGKIRDGLEFSSEDRSVVVEALQEMANGLAANLDNKFTGGDTEAKLVGDSILATSRGIHSGELVPHDYRRLVYASSGYVRKQEAFWSRKLVMIYNFASKEGFTLPEVNNRIAKVV